jgi:hypothetical protein
MASTPFLTTLDATVKHRHFRLIVQYDQTDLQTPIEPKARLYELSANKSEASEPTILSAPQGEPGTGWILGAQLEAGKIIADITGEHPVWKTYEP